MAKEIERKFLIHHHVWQKMAKPQPAAILQGYILADQTTSVRVRIYNNTAILNIKKSIDALHRYEYEYEIPFADAELMMHQICKSDVQKKRYEIQVDAHLWEIDVFEGPNTGLIVAEIELEDAAEIFETPDWIADEVTHDPRYLNTSLAEKPFNTWKL